MPSHAKGGYYFMSLLTGQKLHAMQWKDLPISDDAIARVHHLANMQKQPTMIDGPLFEWQPGAPVNDIDTPTQYSMHLYQTKSMRQM